MIIAASTRGAAEQGVEFGREACAKRTRGGGRESGTVELSAQPHQPQARIELPLVTQRCGANLARHQVASDRSLGVPLRQNAAEPMSGDRGDGVIHSAFPWSTATCG
jgi:hypothetical protein